jgi:hypothetical protein
MERQMTTEMIKVLEESIVTICGLAINEIKTSRDVERFMDYFAMDTIDDLNKGRLNEDELNVVYNSIRNLLEERYVVKVPF